MTTTFIIPPETAVRLASLDRRCDWHFGRRAEYQRQTDGRARLRRAWSVQIWLTDDPLGVAVSGIEPELIDALQIAITAAENRAWHMPT